MRHAGVLVMSSEADIGRVSASELFSQQQTCKWIPNGLFTYITLAGAPLQGPEPSSLCCATAEYMNSTQSFLSIDFKTLN